MCNILAASFNELYTTPFIVIFLTDGLLFFNLILSFCFSDFIGLSVAILCLTIAIISGEEKMLSFPYLYVPLRFLVSAIRL